MLSAYRGNSLASGAAASGKPILISFSGGSPTFTNLTVTGNTILGDASGDTLTINAGTWTIGSNYTATRAVGAAGSGSNNFQKWDSTYTGHADGTTTANAFYIEFTGSGANAVIQQQTLVTQSNWDGSATLTTLRGINTEPRLRSTGNVSNMQAYFSTLGIQGAGNVTTGTIYEASTPVLSSTGAFTNLFGFNVQNIGHATLVGTAIAFKANDITASVTAARGMQLSLETGTNKHNLYIDGTAHSVHAGNLRIGSTVNPTVALDITGAVIISSTLQSGRMGIGAPALTSTVLFIDALLTTGVSQNGLIIQSIFSNAAVTKIRSIASVAQLQDGGGVTYASVTGLEILDAVKLGVADTVTLQTGIDVLALIDGTTTYGIRSQTAAAANRWNLYIDGTANNAFAGNVRIGSAIAPTVALDVTGAALISSTLGVTGKLSVSQASFLSTGGAPTTGNAVLVAGTKTVNTTAINTADTVLLTRKTSGGTLGTAITYTISDGVSFTITSDSALDTSTFSWVIVKAH